MYFQREAPRYTVCSFLPLNTVGVRLCTCHMSSLSSNQLCRGIEATYYNNEEHRVKEDCNGMAIPFQSCFTRCSVQLLTSLYHITYNSNEEHRVKQDCNGMVIPLRSCFTRCSVQLLTSLYHITYWAEQWPCAFVKPKHEFCTGPTMMLLKSALVVHFSHQY